MIHEVVLRLFGQAFNTKTKNETFKVNFNVFLFNCKCTEIVFLSLLIGIQLLCNNVFEMVVSNIFRHHLPPLI